MSSVQHYDSRYKIIVEKLDLLRRTNPTSHNYPLTAPLSEEKVAAFEKEHSVSLPDDYRGFLLNVGESGAGPEYGLKALTAFQRASLPSVVAVVKDASGTIVSSAGTGDRPELERPADPSLPFLLKEAWCPVDNDGNATPLPLPAGANPYDGCLELAEIGCGYFYFLVLTGDQKGQVWVDYTAGDGSVAPEGKTFIDWYERWLDDCLRSALLSVIRAEFNAENERAQARASGKVKKTRQRKSTRAHLNEIQTYLPLFESQRSNTTNDSTRFAFASMELGFALDYLNRVDEAVSLLEAYCQTAPAAAGELCEHLYRHELAHARLSPPKSPKKLARHREPAVRHALAGNEKTPKSVLLILADDSYAPVRRRVAQNKSCHAAVIERLLQWAEQSRSNPIEERSAMEVLELLAVHPKTPANLRSRLAHLSNDIEPGTLADIAVRAVAGSRYALKEDLRALANHKAPWVRHAVACNKKTPAKVLLSLSRDEHLAVQLAAAQNPKTPTRRLIEFARSEHAYVRHAVGKNPRLPLIEMERLACDADHEVAYSIARNPSVSKRALKVLRAHPQSVVPSKPGMPDTSTASVLTALAGTVIQEQLFDHPSFPVALIDRYLDAIEHPAESSIQLDKPDMAAYAFAKNPWLTLDQFKRLARHSYSYVQRQLAGSPHTPIEILAQLGESGNGIVCMFLPTNPRLPLEQAIFIAHHPDDEVRLSAGAHPDLPIELLYQLANDPYNYTRRSVLWNPNCPADLIEKLARDPDVEVRKWAPLNPKTPKHILKELADDQDKNAAWAVMWRKKRDALLKKLNKS